MRSCTEEIGLDVLQSTDEKITQNTLTASPVPTFFDPAKEKLSRDASEDGIGAVLLQAENWKLVADESMTESVLRLKTRVSGWFFT